MSYYLSEAYENLYNPRVDSVVDDNLQFIDFMSDEDIQEVVESVFWELRDYGNTLEESLDTLSLITTDEVITEAYDDILLEFKMSDAERTKLAGKVAKGRGLKYAQKLADKGRREQRTARIQGAVRSVRKRVDGPISRAKAAFKGAQGGLGKAAQATSQAAQEGKAKLGKLLRRGIKAVAGEVRATGRGIGRVGKSIEKRGASASQAGLKSRQAGRVGSGGQMQLVFEPTAQEKTGGTVSKVGRAIRKVGAAIARTPSKVKSELSGGKNKAKLDQMRAARASRASATPDTSAFERRGFDVTKKSSTAVRPKGKQTTAKGVPYSSLSPQKAKESGRMQTVSRQRREAGPSSARVAPGTTGQRGEKKERGGATYDERGRRLREDYDLILDQILSDLISEGYAENEESALNILNNLNEETINELVQEYLD